MVYNHRDNLSIMVRFSMIELNDYLTNKSEPFVRVCKCVGGAFVHFIQNSKTDTYFSRSWKSCKVLYIILSCIYLYGMSRLIFISSLLVTRVNSSICKL